MAENNNEGFQNNKSNYQQSATRYQNIAYTDSYSSTNALNSSLMNTVTHSYHNRNIRNIRTANTAPNTLHSNTKTEFNIFAKKFTTAIEQTTKKSEQDKS